MPWTKRNGPSASSFLLLVIGIVLGARELRRGTPPILTSATTEHFNFRIGADRQFKEFERLAEVLGVDNPQTQMAEVLERVLDLALDQKDPKRKRERPLEKERTKGVGEEKSRPDEIFESSVRSVS